MFLIWSAPAPAPATRRIWDKAGWSFPPGIAAWAPEKTALAELQLHWLSQHLAELDLGALVLP